MKTMAFCAVFLLSSVSMAKTYGSVEQKKAFAATAIADVLKDNKSDYTLVPNSVDIDSCEGFAEKVHRVVGAIVGESADCNIATFYVINSEAKVFASKMIITTQPKEVTNLIGLKHKSDVKAFDLRFSEMKDPKTNEAIYMGMHSMNSKGVIGQSMDDLFSLERVSGPAIKKQTSGAK